VYADDANIMGENLNTIMKNVESLSQATRVVSLKVIREKIKNMIMSRHRNAALK